MADMPFNNRYQRKFTDPFDCACRRAFADNAVQKTYEAVQELSMSLAGEQIARDAAEYLVRAADPGEVARRQRRRRAVDEGWTAGEPGE